VWAAKAATRRSIVEGLLVSLMGWENTQALQLRAPEYFNEVVDFVVDGVTYFDEPDVIRNRRRAHVAITMTAPVVAHVNYVTQKVSICLGGPLASHVYDGNVYLDLGLTLFDRNSIHKGSCYQTDEPLDQEEGT